jgi:hypothetical protein
MREPARYSAQMLSVSSFQSFTELKHLFLNLDEFHTQSITLDPRDEDGTQLSSPSSRRPLYPYTYPAESPRICTGWKQASAASRRPF